MNEELRLQRTLNTGQPDGIYRCDDGNLPITEDTLIRAARDTPDFVDRVVAIAEHAPVRGGAIAALALIFKHAPLRLRAAGVVHRVCRTGEDLLRLAGAIRQLDAWTQATRQVLSQWYLDAPVSTLEAARGSDMEPDGRHAAMLDGHDVRTDDPARQAALARLAAPAPRRVGSRDDRADARTEPAIRWPVRSRRHLVALDASATLECGSILGWVPKALTAQWGLAAVAAQDEVVAFRQDGWHDEQTRWRTGVCRLDWRATTSLASAVRDLPAYVSGPPDPALLVRYALAQRLKVDAFIIIGARAPWTSPDTWRSALEVYRRDVGASAMVVVGLKAGGPTLADPTDPDSWGVMGFQPETPSMVAYLAGL